MRWHFLLKIVCVTFLFLSFFDRQNIKILIDFISMLQFLLQLLGPFYLKLLDKKKTHKLWTESFEVKRSCSAAMIIMLSILFNSFNMIVTLWNVHVRKYCFSIIFHEWCWFRMINFYHFAVMYTFSHCIDRKRL